MRARRLHIVGCYRSGTTLMMELMWRCFSFGGRAEHEASLFDPIPEGEALYLTKKPPDTPHIESAFRRDDNLFLIAMLRDPRAVIASQHASRPGLYFRGFHHWRQCARTIRRLAEHPRFLLVRFEDLVTEPDAVQEQIEQRFGFLERRARFSDYPAGVEAVGAARRSLRGIRPLDPARIDAWREHLPRISAQLAKHPDLSASMVEFGYEENDDWATVLDGIAPAGRGYKDKAPHILKRCETAWRYHRRTRAYLTRIKAG